MEPTRLLLALANQEIAGALRDAMPAVKVSEVGAWDPLPENLAGPLWCFIEWLLPDISGLELCRRVRTAEGTAHAQIVMVLDKSDDGSRRRALKAGADDYVAAPLTVEAVAQRMGHRPDGARRSTSMELKCGPLELDPLAHRAWFEGKPIDLQPKQLALLAHLMNHPDRVHSRMSLIEELGNGDGLCDERTVDAWVARLRRALRRSGAPDLLRTVRQYGYVFDSI
jgi:two-component system phosphate regulon response regulator PhoB